jgi:integrase
LQEKVSEINGKSKPVEESVLFGQVIDRFVANERLEEIYAQPPGETTVKGMAWSTAKGYLSYFKNHVRPRWAEVPVDKIEPPEVVDWLEGLPLSGLTKGHLKGIMHLLFEKATYWKFIPRQRNPIDLVRVKGVTRRKKRPIILTIEQCQQIIALLEDPYKTMTIVAMCTALRVSEVLALRWDHLNLSAGTLRVQQGAVNGRIGPVKTAASEDEVPLDAALVESLRSWRTKTSGTGLLFSSETGGAYHSTTIRQYRLQPAGEKLGLLNVGWHTFRHSHRSILDETGHLWGTAESDAAFERDHNHERLRQCIHQGKSRCQFQSRSDDSSTSRLTWGFRGVDLETM